jgi:hypothetical protein
MPKHDQRNHKGQGIEDSESLQPETGAPRRQGEVGPSVDTRYRTAAETVAVGNETSGSQRNLRRRVKDNPQTASHPPVTGYTSSGKGVENPPTFSDAVYNGPDGHAYPTSIDITRRDLAELVALHLLEQGLPAPNGSLSVAVIRVMAVHRVTVASFIILGMTLTRVLFRNVPLNFCCG